MTLWCCLAPHLWKTGTCEISAPLPGWSSILVQASTPAPALVTNQATPGLQVFCNGEEVLTTSGTQQSYTVDIWSGNHPFFQGAASTVLTDEGSVNRFKRRYGGLDSLTDMTRIKTGADITSDAGSMTRARARMPVGGSAN